MMRRLLVILLSICMAIPTTSCSMFSGGGDEEVTVEDMVDDLERLEAFIITVGNVWIAYLQERGHDWIPVANQLNAALQAIETARQELLVEESTDFTNLLDLLRPIKEAALAYITTLHESGEIEQEDFDKMVQRLETMSSIARLLVR